MNPQKPRKLCASKIWRYTVILDWSPSENQHGKRQFSVLNWPYHGYSEFVHLGITLCCCPVLLWSVQSQSWWCVEDIQSWVWSSCWTTKAGNGEGNKHMLLNDNEIKQSFCHYLHCSYLRRRWKTRKKLILCNSGMHTLTSYMASSTDQRESFWFVVFHNWLMV